MNSTRVLIVKQTETPKIMQREKSEILCAPLAKVYVYATTWLLFLQSLDFRLVSCTMSNFTTLLFFMSRNKLEFRILKKIQITSREMIFLTLKLHFIFCGSQLHLARASTAVFFCKRFSVIHFSFQTQFCYLSNKSIYKKRNYPTCPLRIHFGFSSSLFPF